MNTSARSFEEAKKSLSLRLKRNVKESGFKKPLEQDTFDQPF